MNHIKYLFFFQDLDENYEQEVINLNGNQLAETNSKSNNNTVQV